MKQRVTVNGRFGMFLAWLLVKLMNMETRDVVDENAGYTIPFEDYFYWRNEGYSDGAAKREMIPPLNPDGFDSHEQHIAMRDAYHMGYTYGRISRVELTGDDDDQD